MLQKNLFQINDFWTLYLSKNLNIYHSFHKYIPLKVLRFPQKQHNWPKSIMADEKSALSLLE